MAKSKSKTERGRPKGITREPICVKIPIWLLDWVRQHAKNCRQSQGKIIEKALIEHYKIKE